MNDMGKTFEDGALMAFVKGRLEEGSSPGRECLCAIEREAREEAFRRASARRRRWGFGAVGLAAASLAVACMFAAMRPHESLSPESTVAGVIDLLRAAEGDETGGDGESVAEMLLAWQDAPYEMAVAGVFPGS